MNLLFTYYGDDFTGSTDALESLAASGVPAVLFLRKPGLRECQRFAGYRAIGLAGESRSRTPEWMEESLPEAFAWLRSLGAPICQYKVCSTFDSAPHVGNIGVAMRLGREVFGGPWVPVVVAAPHLRRYVLFGNLFAGAGGSDVFRIDRHPTMSRHPVTPMHESDLRQHLNLQGQGEIALLDILALHGTDAAGVLDEIVLRSPGAVVFDGLDERSELETGRLLWRRRAEHPFVAGSSGLTRALIRHWRETGMIPATFTPAVAEPADRIVVVSGSCSPVTEVQIRYAIRHGFEGIHTANLGSDELLSRARDALRRGKNPILYSALGPNDLHGSLTGEALGCFLGGVLRELVVESGVRRAVIAGGDTSTYAAGQLGIDALTFAALLAPGAPLCRAHSGDAAIDGLELVLKGGQVGGADFFLQVEKGPK